MTVLQRDFIIEHTDSSLNFKDDEDVIRVSDIEEFFSQNVVIPKGKNRHPDADAIHHLAERTLIVEIKSNEPDGRWGIEGINDFSYRIKPSEPVYEYKALLFQLTGDYILSDWITIDEFNSSTLSGSILLETKRVRQ